MDEENLLDRPGHVAGDLPFPDDQPEPSHFSPAEADEVEAIELEPHPFADMFPMMNGEDFDALVVSIRDDGQEEPIVTYEGKILDGRNRHAACIAANVDAECVKYEGDDPLEFVLRKNLHRRQLKTSQRAMVAANLATMKQGERTDLEPSANLQKVSVKDAANTLKVSPRSVEDAKTVLACRDRGLIKEVESGKKSVSAAVKQLAEPSETDATPPDGKRECERLRKQWNKTGDEGQALFLKAIGATMA